MVLTPVRISDLLNLLAVTMLLFNCNLACVRADAAAPGAAAPGAMPENGVTSHNTVKSTTFRTATTTVTVALPRKMVAANFSNSTTNSSTFSPVTATMWNCSNSSSSTTGSASVTNITSTSSHRHASVTSTRASPTSSTNFAGRYEAGSVAVVFLAGLFFMF